MIGAVNHRSIFVDYYFLKITYILGAASQRIPYKYLIFSPYMVYHMNKNNKNC
jgi:hypothetical protein